MPQISMQAVFSFSEKSITQKHSMISVRLNNMKAVFALETLTLHTFISLYTISAASDTVHL